MQTQCVGKSHAHHGLTDGACCLGPTCIASATAVVPHHVVRVTRSPVHYWTVDSDGSGTRPANPDLLLKPDMYATVVIDAGAAGQEVLTVPESALLDDGARRIVLAISRAWSLPAAAATAPWRSPADLPPMSGSSSRQTS